MELSTVFRGSFQEFIIVTYEHVCTKTNNEETLAGSTLKNGKKAKTSMDINARNGSAPNSLNWNKFIAMNYEYLVTLVVLKNAVVTQNIKWKNSQLTLI